MADLNASEHLTADQVAAMIQRPRSTVLWWRHVGEGPRSFKLGRRVMYLRTDVEKWITEQYEADAHRYTPSGR